MKSKKGSSLRFQEKEWASSSSLGYSGDELMNDVDEKKSTFFKNFSKMKQPRMPSHINSSRVVMPAV
jgi:hypothetical protein